MIEHKDKLTLAAENLKAKISPGWKMKHGGENTEWNIERLDKNSIALLGIVEHIFAPSIVIAEYLKDIGIAFHDLLICTHKSTDSRIAISKSRVKIRIENKLVVEYLSKNIFTYPV